MPPFLRLIHAGDWRADQVTSAFASSTLTAPTEVQERIDAAWTAALAVPGRHLFDGPMCRLESFEASPAGVRIGMSRTSYKAFWGTHLSHPDLADRFGANVLASPIGVSPALETADGWLLLGRRNERVAYYPGRVHPFAGCLEPSDTGAAGADSSAPDLFAAIERELAEELHLRSADIEAVRLTGLAQDVRLRQPELIFHVKTAVTRARVEAQVDDAEHHGVVAIRADAGEVERAVEASRGNVFTPVAVASLLLWGRLRFGTRWFRTAAARAAVEQADP